MSIVIRTVVATALLGTCSVSASQDEATPPPTNPTTPSTLATGPSTQPAEEAEEGFALTVYSTADPAFDWAQWEQQARRNRGYSGYGGSYGSNALPGYGVVRETRKMQFEEGHNTVRFTGVAAGIDPTTLRFRDFADPTAAVLEQSYEYDLLDPQKLLQKYVGKSIRLDGSPVRLLDVAGSVLVYEEGDGGPVKFRSAENGTSSFNAVELPDTAGLNLEPTLVWDVQTGLGGERPVQVTYETSGLTWRADYTIVTNEEDTAVDVGAWVTLVNQSGLGYPETRLKLVAGDVQRVHPEQYVQRLGGLGGGGMGGGGGQPQFEEKSFFEYHLYTLQRPTSLKDNSTKQIELFPTVEQVPAEKVFVYYGLPEQVRYHIAPSPNQDRNLGTQSNKKVDIYLRFENAEENGMGIPLPAGKLRVYKRDEGDDTLEFIGEDIIQHTPREEEVLVRLGSAFDLVGERTQKDFRIDHAARWMEEDIEIKLRNRKEQPVEILVRETLYRWVNWEIIEQSDDFEKQDSRTIHFPVSLDPDEEVTITYTVRYTW